MCHRFRRFAFSLAAAAALSLAPGLAAGTEDHAADSDHVDYYYPAPTSSEVFDRELVVAAEPADRSLRLRFLEQLNEAHRETEGRMRYMVFAKGGDAEHMIIVALEDQIFQSLFRARAVLAALTSEARQTDFMRDNRIEDQATWFDLAKILGFDDLVITDGTTWSHRVDFR